MICFRNHFLPLILSKLLTPRLYFKVKHYCAYKRHGGSAYLANLKNPKTFNEKTLWLKLNVRDSLGSIIADKYAVREWVKQRVGPDVLIPLLGVYQNTDDIDFDALPDQFVLKSNHGSGMVLVCREKAKLDKNYSLKKLRNWLKINYFSRSGEWQYKGIKPLILAEELLSPDGPLEDYKFFCFNGAPKYVQVDFDRFTNHTRTFYNLNWENQKFTTFYPLADKDVPKPGALPKMIEIAEKLSAPFHFVRVDLYYVNKKIYFGELTLHHGGGYEPFFPARFDRILGDELSLPQIQ